MDKISFAEAEYTQKLCAMRREKFLVQMELSIPWKILEKKIKPHCPKREKAGSPIRYPRC